MINKIPFAKDGQKIGIPKNLKSPKAFFKILFFLIGFLSLIWFLIRVIPKPSRATYPCMKETMPIASSFVIYLLSLSGSVLLFIKTISKGRTKQFWYYLRSRNSGSARSSLGLHEYWNNTNDMQYTRNLGASSGIELVKI